MDQNKENLIVRYGNWIKLSLRSFWSLFTLLMVTLLLQSIWLMRSVWILIGRSWRSSLWKISMMHLLMWGGVRQMHKVTTSSTATSAGLPLFLNKVCGISMIRHIWVFNWLTSNLNDSWPLWSSSIVIWDMFPVQSGCREISLAKTGSLNKRPSTSEIN